MDILNVEDFTKSLQKSVKDNLVPDIKKVTDFTKDFNNNIKKGNWEVASGPMSEVTDLTKHGVTSLENSRF